MSSFLLGLSRALLQLALNAALKRALPTIFRRLDVEIPLMLTNNAPPAHVKGTIASAISDVLGRRADPTEISLVQALYDPVIAATKAPRYSK